MEKINKILNKILNKMLNKSLQEVLNNKDQITFNEPFIHYVIKDLFDPEILSQVGSSSDLIKNGDEFGSLGGFDSPLEKKLAISNVKEIGKGKIASKILNYLNSSEFVEFLEKLTGIQNLIVDPNFIGGGIHLIPSDGRLGVHVDFSRAPFDGTKYRRLNVLLYLNKDWKEEWNGALELWDGRPSEGGKNIKNIYPHFNTLVIFGTAKDSWHGHPIPTTSPQGIFRTSLATYYYSDTPGDDLEVHSTIF